MNTELSDGASVAGDQAGWHVAAAITAEQLAGRVEELGRQISADYHGRELLVVGMLKGAWVFMADLVRQLSIPTQCDFVRVSSYGSGMQSSGEPKLLADISEPIAGRDVLLVDDIIDTGLSIRWVRDRLWTHRPSSVRLCVLLSKPARRQVAVEADYVGFQIPDRFVVGYGIDYAEHCRGLPYVGYVIPDGGPSAPAS